MDDYWYEVYGGVVKGVVTTQRLRARPARDDLAPLYLVAKGQSGYGGGPREYERTFELRVVDAAGALRPAASFHEYIQYVVGELAAFRYALVSAVAEQYDDEDDDEGQAELIGEMWDQEHTSSGRFAYRAGTYENRGPKFDLLRIGQDAVPSPLDYVLRACVDLSFLDENLGLDDDACAHFVQSRFDERRLRIVLPKIKELQGLVSARDFGPFKGFLVAADVLPLQEDLASFTNALRWALYSWGDDGERANVFFADFAKDGYQAKGYFGFVDECGDYSPWGHTWAVGTRAELDAAGWAEEAFPNEDAADY